MHFLFPFSLGVTFTGHICHPPQPPHPPYNLHSFLIKYAPSEVNYTSRSAPDDPFSLVCGSV